MGNEKVYRGTTVLAVRRRGSLAMGCDGQVSLGDTIVKSRAVKIRTMADGKILAGFAGSVADALTLVTSQPALRDQLRRRGLAQAARFSWEQAARRTLQLYQEVVDTP